MHRFHHGRHFGAETSEGYIRTHHREKCGNSEHPDSQYLAEQLHCSDRLVGRKKDEIA
jgi:hypothetical protein